MSSNKSGNEKRKREESFFDEVFWSDLWDAVGEGAWEEANENLTWVLEEDELLPNMHDPRSEESSCTLLHFVASMDDVPFHLVKQLVAVVDTEFSSKPDNDGDTPLHVATAYATSWTLDKVMLLVHASPGQLVTRNNRGQAPIQDILKRTRRAQGDDANDNDVMSFEEALEQCLDACPEAIHYCTRDGKRNLLHLASGSPHVFPSRSLATANLLLERKPCMLLERIATNDTPIHVLAMTTTVNTTLDRMKLYVNTAGTNALHTKGCNGNTPLHYGSTSDSQASVVQFLVASDASLLHLANNDGLVPFEYAQKHTSCGGMSSMPLLLTLLLERPIRMADAPPLHRLLRHRRPQPHIKILFVHSLPEQTATFDAHGYLPIHIVAGGPPPASPIHANEDEDDTLIASRFVHLLTVLLNYVPEACSVRNRNGLLPLQLMARAGHWWDAGVKQVFEAYPAAVEELPLEDLVLLLTNLNKDNDDDGLEGILRTAPSLMRT